MLYSISFSSKKNQHLPLLVSFIGYHHLQESTIRPMGSPFYQWFFCCEGIGELVFGNQKSVIHKGQCFLIYAGEAHSYRGLTENFTIHVLGFGGPCCQEILKTCGMFETGVYQINKPSVFTECMQSVVALHNQEDATQNTYAKLCFGFLVDLGSCIQKINTPEPEGANELVNSIAAYLEEHFRETITLDELAHEVNLTKSYMCALFKNELNHTIMQHLLLIRIGWSRIYLEQYPELNVYEIGKMCGFESPSYFGKKFLEITGVTPEKYKYTKSICI